LSQAMEAMIVNGWAGFKSGWIKPAETKSTDWWVNDRRIK